MRSPAFSEPGQEVRDETLWGYPKGIYLVAFTELWERFSYWGMIAILVLFLTAGLEQGGFGWARADALHLYGMYAGAAFAGPLIGGWIANRYWGERRCIVIGGLLVAIGHLCLAGPELIPQFLARDVSITSVWVEAGVPLGQLFLAADDAQRLVAAAEAHALSDGAVLRIYHSVSVSFLGGLLLLVIGTAFIKPTISSIVGRFFSPGDTRRDGAFAMFFVAIYVGSILGTFVVGLLGERVAWHWGFFAAAVGMFASLALYLWKQQDYLGDVGREPVLESSLRQALQRLTHQERERIKVIFIQSMFAAAYAAAFYQSGGALVLFIKERVAREAFGWTIPTSWFINVATLAFIVVTPLATALWSRWRARGRVVNAPMQLGWGLLLIGGAYVLLGLLSVTLQSDPQATIAWFWIVAIYVCFGISDVLVWPNQIAMTSKLAPSELSAVFVGGWYVSIGVGTAISGALGALASEWGEARFFIGLGAVLLCLGWVALRIVPTMRAWMHGVE